MVIRTPILWTDPGVLRSSGAKEASLSGERVPTWTSFAGRGQDSPPDKPLGTHPQGRDTGTPRSGCLQSAQVSPRWLVKMALNFR